MAYVGTPLDTTNAFQSLAGKRFNGDGSTTDFTLDSAPNSTLDIEVFVGNVRQDPNSAYTVSGTTLAFTGAPPSGTNNIYVVHQAKAVGTISIPDDTISSQTDIGAAIVDADLFLIDDGGGGTIRKTAASRLSTYISPSTATDTFTINGSTPTLTIGDAGAEDTKIVFDGNAQDYHIGLDDSSDDLVIGLGSTLGTTSYLNIDEAGKLSTGGETAPDVDAGGLCLDQNATDDVIFSAKSSDVAHGVTTRAETDTYYQIQKTNGPDGGGQVYHFRENAENAMYYHGVGVGSLGTTKSVNESGLISLRAHLKGGGTDTDGTITSNGNMLTIHAHNTTRFIFDAEGDLHADSSSTTFDTYDDAQLARAFDLSHGRGVIKSKFDKFVAYNHEKLADLQLVGREKDGTPNHFINVTGMQRLHNGAIWQQYEKHNQLLEAVYDLAKEAVGEEKANAILDKHEVKRLQ